mgnify:FL=1
MKNALISAASLVVLAFATPSLAQTTTDPSTSNFDLSGGMDVYDKYLFDDLYIANEGVVAQPTVRVTHSSGVYLDGWASIGLESDDGNEFDGTIGYKKGPVEVLVAYFAIPGPDLIATKAILTIGNLGLHAEHYTYKPENGWRVSADYNVQVTEKFSVQPTILYEHGIGLPDIVIGGVNLSYDMSDRLSVNFAGLVALDQAKNDPRRGAEFSIGLGYHF